MLHCYLCRADLKRHLNWPAPNRDVSFSCSPYACLRPDPYMLHGVEDDFGQEFICSTQIGQFDRQFAQYLAQFIVELSIVLVCLFQLGCIAHYVFIQLYSQIATETASERKKERQRQIVTHTETLNSLKCVEKTN